MPPDTLEERITRLEDENAKLREIAAEVARGPVESDPPKHVACVFCGQPCLVGARFDDALHTPSCPVLKARALLAPSHPS